MKSLSMRGFSVHLHCTALAHTNILAPQSGGCAPTFQTTRGNTCGLDWLLGCCCKATRQRWNIFPCVWHQWCSPRLKLDLLIRGIPSQDLHIPAWESGSEACSKFQSNECYLFLQASEGCLRRVPQSPPRTHLKHGWEGCPIQGRSLTFEEILSPPKLEKMQVLSHSLR